MNPTRTEAIKRFLTVKTHPDLAELYNFSMECQVNVAQDGGERIEGTFQGKNWRGWSDGITTWKAIRIPYNANTEAKYDDKPMKFDLAEHAEGIGMTGWNWKSKLSLWVAYDFDSIIGHSEKHQRKLTDEELQSLIKLLSEIEWVTLRRSTGGKGLHLYVFLAPVSTQNHTEHAALARAILGKLTAITGYDFSSKVDICGGNMWVWHRKMTCIECKKKNLSLCEHIRGLELIKQGTKLEEPPPNWQDHIIVTKGKRKKNLPQFIDDLQIEEKEDLFEELTGQRAKVPLDAGHRKLIDWLTANNCFWWFDNDHWMVVTHTHHLKQAHEILGLRGPFETLAAGTETPNDHNCFLFPMRNGGWSVRRYSPGVQEAPTWDQDGAGWTRCFYNRAPDLATASRVNEGVEDKSGGYNFRHAESAIKAARLLGANIDIPAFVSSRKTQIMPHKQDNKIVITFDAETDDDSNKLLEWSNKKGKWERVVTISSSSHGEPETTLNLDDTIRHLITTRGEDHGWVIKSEGTWRTEPWLHVKTALASLGYTPKEVTAILGSGIFKAWTMVNIPFGPEYPGDRRWNRESAQLRYALKPDKENLSFPTWLKILNHIGANLDDTIKTHPWCQSNGIFSGADYLLCWIASLFQDPMQPLPYLFMYGPQDSGKSIFHEALKMLMNRGVVRADAALISQSNFNGELESAIVCIVEETNLQRHKQAYNKIKDWVTSPDLLIHRKQQTPYSVENTTHWIQCSNDHLACPVFQGDTRITMIFVPELSSEEKIPKKEMMNMLDKEASDFLTHVLALELPLPVDRLNIPVIVTNEKLLAQEANLSFLEMFIKEKTFYVRGHIVEFADFHNRYLEWLDPAYHHHWSKIRVTRELPPQFPKGRWKENKVCVGNIAFEEISPNPFKIVVRDGKLEELLDIKESRNGSTIGSIQVNSNSERSE